MQKETHHLRSKLPSLMVVLISHDEFSILVEHCARRSASFNLNVTSANSEKRLSMYKVINQFTLQTLYRLNIVFETFYWLEFEHICFMKFINFFFNNFIFTNPCANIFIESRV